MQTLDTLESLAHVASPRAAQATAPPPGIALVALAVAAAALMLVPGIASASNTTRSHAHAHLVNSQNSCKPPIMWLIVGLAHDGDDFLDAGRVGRVAHAFVSRRAAAMVAGHRGGGTGSPGDVELVW